MKGWLGIIAVTALGAGLTFLVRWLTRHHPIGRGLLESPAGIGAVACLASVALASLVAPFIAPADPTDLGVVSALAPPSWNNPLGGDDVGRDVFSRVLYGGRISLLVAATAVAVSATLGVAFGLLAGVAGGVVDQIIMRGVDAALSVPRLILLLVVIGLWDRVSPVTLALLLGATGWFVTSRLVRAEVLAVRKREFVWAAAALGASPGRIVARNILPQIAATASVSATLSIAGVLLTEAGISYLGLMSPAPHPTWGSLINDGGVYLRSHPWLALAPGLAVTATIVSINAIGDRLRAVLNPRDRR